MAVRLTPEIENQLLQFIRAGGFDWVAAEAAGVPRDLFRQWLEKGRRTARSPFRRLHLNVMTARAQARLTAEIQTRDKDPRFWLKHGPGRERPDAPGWTNPVKAQYGKSRPPSRDDMQLAAELKMALAPIPDAHARVVELLHRHADVASPDSPNRL